MTRASIRYRSGGVVVAFTDNFEKRFTAGVYEVIDSRDGSIVACTEDDGVATEILWRNEMRLYGLGAMQ